MRRVGKSQSSGGVLRVVALQDGAAAAAAAAAHEARREGRGWLSMAKKAALVGSLGSLGVGALKLARSSSGPLSMQGMNTFDVLDEFDRQIQKEAAEAQARSHSFGMESAENEGEIAPVIEEGSLESLESLERGAAASGSRHIAMFCASRVHDLRDIVNGTDGFLKLSSDDKTRQRYEELALRVLRLLLDAKNEEKSAIGDSAADSADRSALDAQIWFLARALSADDDGDGSDSSSGYSAPRDLDMPDKPIENPVLRNVHSQPLGDTPDRLAIYGHMATWDVRRVTDMSYAFSGMQADSPVMGMCADLSFWDTRRVQTMAGMFQDAVAFNGKIGTWHTANVKDMRSMFLGASVFNQDIGSWMTGNVTIMAGMFQGAVSFDKPIGGWKTGATENMSGMFANARAFNQPIGDWDVTSVMDMKNMFFGASRFNQDLSKWRPKRTTLNTKIGGMFHGSGFKHADAIIGAWNLIDNSLYEAGLPLRGSSVPSFGTRGRGRAFV